MELVCDTNVWYDLAAGRRSAVALKGPGHSLMVSPVSFIELLSKVSERTFEERRLAAGAVLDHATGILLDPERHFAQLWELPVPNLGIDWMDAFQALAEASSIGEIRTGVPDLIECVTRTLRPEIAGALRDVHYQDFVQGVERLIDSFCPGYLAARSAKRAKYMDAKSASLFRSAIESPEVERLTGVGTRLRAALHLESPAEEPTDEEVDRVLPDVLPYVRAYGRFVLNCASKFTARPNDWGDLECFAYLQGERRLLTRDSRWIEVAQQADLADWLFDPEL